MPSVGAISISHPIKESTMLKIGSTVMLLAVALCGCDGYAQVQHLSATKIDMGMHGYSHRRMIKITNRDDVKTTITDVIANRGQCGKFAYVTIPLTLAFGEVANLVYETCDPIEVQLFTNKGNITFTFTE